MRYFGIDVHITTTVWCLLDEHGEIVDRGKIPSRRFTVAPPVLAKTIDPASAPANPCRDGAVLVFPLTF